MISFLVKGTLSLGFSYSYTLSHTKPLENHTLHSGTYLYSPYMTVTPHPTQVSTLVIAYSVF